MVRRPSYINPKQISAGEDFDLDLQLENIDFGTYVCLFWLRQLFFIHRACHIAHLCTILVSVLSTHENLEPNLICCIGTLSWLVYSILFFLICLPHG